MGIKDILLNPPLKDFRRGKILALSFGARGVSWGEGGLQGSVRDRVRSGTGRKLTPSSSLLP